MESTIKQIKNSINYANNKLIEDLDIEEIKFLKHFRRNEIMNLRYFESLERQNKLKLKLMPQVPNKAIKKIINILDKTLGKEISNPEADELTRKAIEYLEFFLED